MFYRLRYSNQKFSLSWFYTKWVGGLADALLKIDIITRAMILRIVRKMKKKQGNTIKDSRLFRNTKNHTKRQKSIIFFCRSFSKILFKKVGLQFGLAFCSNVMSCL
jgi:hypothetical protein